MEQREDNKINVLIVEDEPAIAIEIAMNLEQRGFNTIGPAHSSEKALDLLYKSIPDIVLLDINIEGSRNGIEIARIINNKYQIPFIYLTSYSNPETVAEASMTMPYGYIVKPFKDEDIAPAIHVALAKRKAEQRNGLPSLDQFNKNYNLQISAAEYRIIELIWEGHGNQKIADKAFLSINTVKSHLRSIYTKLLVKNKSELLTKIRDL